MAEKAWENRLTDEDLRGLTPLFYGHINPYGAPGGVCTFAREPQRRKVGGDARVSIEGVLYEVEPDLAGESVTLWFGLFDDELYIEHGKSRYGPYRPIGGPIPLHRYRRFKKTRTEERAERVVALAELLALPRAALTDRPELAVPLSAFELRSEPFTDPILSGSWCFRPRWMPSGPSPIISVCRWENYPPNSWTRSTRC